MEFIININANQNILFCMCVALHGRYVLFFGGFNEHYSSIDDIFVYSVRDQLFTESRMKCPEKGLYDAVSICDRDRDKCITFGFVRDCWSKCGINNHLFPPEYLIRIMLKYYWNEFVHLIDLNYDGYHWRRDVFDIVS